MTEDARRGKEHVNFKCPPLILDWLDQQVDDGIFASRSEAILPDGRKATQRNGRHALRMEGVGWAMPTLL